MPYEVISAAASSAIFKAFTTTKTQSLTGAKIGNAWLAAVAATTTLSAPTGGSATWQKLAGPNQNTGGTPLVNFELWLGTITSLSAANVTINASGSPTVGGYFKEMTCDGASAATVWGLDVGDVRDNASNSLNVPFPALTPLGLRRAYGGMTIVGSDVAASGQPSDYTVFRDTTFFNALMWKPYLDDMSTESPVLVQSTSNDSYNCGALFWARNPDEGLWLPT